MRIDRYYNLVRERAWYFSKASRLDYDEVYGEAVHAFVKAIKNYNPKHNAQASPATFIWRVVTNALIVYCRRYSINIEEEYDIEKVLISSLTPAHSYQFKSMCRELPKDCRFVIHLILNKPELVVRQYKKNVKLNKRTIGRYLREMGWKTPRIDQAYTNIETALSCY